MDVLLFGLHWAQLINNITLLAASSALTVYFASYASAPMRGKSTVARLVSSVRALVMAATVIVVLGKEFNKPHLVESRVAQVLLNAVICLAGGYCGWVWWQWSFTPQSKDSMEYLYASLNPKYEMPEE